MKIREIISEAEELVLSRQEFRDELGVLLGTIETVNHRIEGRDRNGRLVGYYETQANITRNYLGVKVGTGNLVTSLFKIFQK